MAFSRSKKVSDGILTRHKRKEEDIERSKSLDADLDGFNFSFFGHDEKGKENERVKQKVTRCYINELLSPDGRTSVQL